MVNYVIRAYIFALGGALYTGLLLPATPTAAEGILRAISITVGLFFVGLAIFYKPKSTK
jgi:hypothetical protein